MFDAVSPDAWQANSPTTQRQEALRRIEVYILEVLHDLLIQRPFHMDRGRSTRTTTAQPQQLQQQKQKATCCARRHDASLTSHPFGSSPTGAGSPFPPPFTACGDSTSHRHLRHLKPLRERLLVASVLFTHLLEGVMTTQRDLYYLLVRQVPSQAVVNAAVQALSHLLQVPRYVLGVVAGVRGSIGGCVYYGGIYLGGGDGTAGVVQGMTIPSMESQLQVQICHPAMSHAAAGKKGERDTEQGPSRVAIDASPVPFLVPPHVRFVVVVEKQAVYHRLLEEGLHHRVPCIVLTSCGFPTHAAHVLLFNLCRALPQATAVGLVDYNPHGVAILSSYRWAGAALATAEEVGGRRWKRESEHYAVPSLRWVGLRTCQLRQPTPWGSAASESAACQSDVDVSALAAPALRFSERDAALLHGLKELFTARLASRGAAPTESNATPLELEEYQSILGWLREVERMETQKEKYEIESVYRQTLPLPPATSHRCLDAITAALATSKSDRSAEKMEMRGRAGVWKGEEPPFASWLCQRLLHHDYI